MSIKARAAPPARTLRERRVIRGRSVPKRKACAPSADDDLAPGTDRGAHLDHCRSRAPPVVSHDSDLLLLLSAEAQFRRSEQTVGNQDISIDAIVDEFGF